MFCLRTVTSEDYFFLYHLHRDALGPYVDEIWGWDDTFQQRHFETNFRPKERQVIQVSGEDVGTLSVLEHDDHLFISLIEILPKYQGQGIGQQVIESLQEEAMAKDKPLLLRVFKINPAWHLYERLGFEVYDSNDVQYFMRWEAS